MNLQQIPARSKLGSKMRECFIPPPSYKFVGGDFSGCELRLLAQFSQDELWLRSFHEGKDLHSVLCAATFNIPIEDVKTPSHFKKELSYRDIQKNLNFGLAYGMSEYKLSSTLEIGVNEAKKIIKDFFSKVPQVESFLNNIGKLGRRNKAIRSGQPYGRIRFFDDPGDDFKRLSEIERASKNMPPQGSNADMTKLALILVYRAIQGRDIKIIHCIHDEIITECHETTAEAWSHEMSVIMKQAAEVILIDIPMKVDCKISDYWTK